MKRTNILAGISGVLICAAWLQPIFLPPWVAFHGEVLAFGALAIISVALKTGSKGNHGLTISFPEVSLFFLLLLIIYQYLDGKIPFLGDVSVYILYLVGFVFAIKVGGAGFSEIDTLECLAWCIAASAVGSVFIALVQTLFIDGQHNLIVPMPSWRRPGANLAQPNNLGTLLLWGQVSVLYLTLAKKLKAMSALVMLGVLTIGVAITESRTALAGILALSIWVTAIPLRMRKMTRVTLSLLYFGISIGVFLAWPNFMAAYNEGAWGLHSGDARITNTQIGAREIVWAQLFGAVNMQPLLGWGFGGIPRALNTVVDQAETSYPFTFAHNIIFDLAIGVGLPFTCFFVMCWLIWIARRTSWSLSNRHWFSLALIIPFLLHSLTEFPFSYAYFLFPAGVAIGALGGGQVAGLRFNIPTGLYWLLYSTWCLLALLVFRDYVSAAEDFRVARMEARKIGYTAVDYVRPKILILDQLDAVNTATRMAPTPNMSAKDLELLEKVAMKYPWAAMQSRYALALALNGNVVEAKRQLNVLRAMQGPENYSRVLENWMLLEKEKYPQLKEVIPFSRKY